jgi:phosphopantothenoylcysteine decarboxylase/phosphopantothenate--cysteine ligase
MHAAVMRHIPQSDIFVSAAAVGDYRSAEIATHKLKKTGNGLSLALTENPDILAEVAARKSRPFVVGFAAETRNLQTYARAKLERKKLDLIAANQVGDGIGGFDTADNELLLLWPEGEEHLARAAKIDLARALIARIATLRHGGSTGKKAKGAKR